MFLFASHVSYEVKIYHVIFSSLFPQKDLINVWSDSAKKKETLSQIKCIHFVELQKNADILLLSKTKNLTSDTMKFVTSYKLLKHYKQSAVGGFYWQKGRPNILFLKKNLQKYHLKLPPSLQEYEVDSL